MQHFVDYEYNILISKEIIQKSYKKRMLDKSTQLGLTDPKPPRYCNAQGMHNKDLLRCLELGAQLLDSSLSGSLQIHQLHGKAHIALDLDLSLKEGLLRWQFSCQQIKDILVADDKGYITFF